MVSDHDSNDRNSVEQIGFVKMICHMVRRIIDRGGVRQLHHPWGRHQADCVRQKKKF